MTPSDHLVSVAPMMKRTDRHFRSMMRFITKRTLLYTEMIPAVALIHGDRDKLLGYDDVEHPIALQLGGDDPQRLAESARIAEDYGYDEVNLNVGCPSPRVQKGNFGACLMLDPPLVARCVEAMRAATSLPVTVKHRIGVDEQEDWVDLLGFVDTLAAAGCARFSVHARKAWLNGLNPKENRNVPPLKPELVYRLKQARPDLLIEINGHIHGSAETAAHLEHVDAVMIGRAAYDDPFSFADIDNVIYGEESTTITRDQIVEAVIEYAAEELRRHGRRAHLRRICQHLMNLYSGQPGARAWRRHMTVELVSDGATEQVIIDALQLVKAARKRQTEIFAAS